MSDSGSGDNNLPSSSVSPKDKKSKNKRKLPDPSLLRPDSPTPTLTQFPPYKSSLSEISQNQLGDLVPLEVVSTPPQQAPQGSQSSQWDDPTTLQLAQLLVSNLHTIFQNAIKQIVVNGYSEDVARRVISRLGLYRGGKDIVSNIVDDALTLLKKGREIYVTRDIVFEDLQEMVEYTAVEMVNVLSEVKPSLSIMEVMWWLLMFDMNISQACLVEGDLLSEFSHKEVSQEGSSDSILPHSRSECQSSKPHSQNPNEPKDSKSSMPDAQNHPPETLKFGSFPNMPRPRNPLHVEDLTTEKKSFASMPGSSEKSLGHTPENIQTTSQTSASEQKLKSGRKVHNKKGYVQFHKQYGKPTFKSGSLASVGTLVVEKKVKPPSESSAVHTKSYSSKAKAKVEVSPADDSHPVPASTPAAVSATDDTTKLPLKGCMLASTAVHTEPAVSAEKKPPSKPEASATLLPKISDYYAGIPYDKSLGKYVPQDEKDKLILKLVPQMQQLQNELQSWTAWANQKVMEAARRLGKDQAELKALRQEKDEAEQLKKEKKVLEDNTMKRLAEMEMALNTSTGEIEKANSTICRLEAEQSLLKMQMEAAKLQATESAASFQEAVEREQKVLKDAQSLGGHKALLREELDTQKQKVAKLQEDLGKAQNRQIQIEARWKQEKMDNKKVLAQAASMRRERELIEAAAKEEEDKIQQEAENDKSRHVEDIKKLENKISELKLQSDASKIAALRRGMAEGKGVKLALEGSQDYSLGIGTGSLRQERECVMCLSEEMSVVFLPCAHQVLCTECNALHEKQGMKDCPSCRTPIEQRIPARYGTP